ncbi:putative serine protease K12H4.7 [Uranotaenia lowii]|uniref:putative serine protease K12H4.7 n=1 Tax=Uranotaenia lowii TaxID=190385 RepID=UPI0024789533|nr:putative serine protease K12H4.7 [Uranotaenia lowii]
MVSKIVIVALVALAAFVLAEEVKKPVRIAPIVDKMLKSYKPPGVPEGYNSTNPHTIGYMHRTRVDHFNPQRRETFEFQYFSNDEFYRPGGPIFIFVGGPWPIEQYYIEHGHFHDIAFYEGAWMFTNEHRYYGRSFPTADLTAENMSFLTVEQAMVDLAEWIWHLKTNVVRDGNAKVILLGTGYAGAMAAWARQRYPHLVDGVWSSSGQMEARLNFKEYAYEIGELIRDHGSDDCYSRIWRGFRTAEALMLAGFTNVVTDMFNTCEPVDNEYYLDVETFFYNIKEGIQTAILQPQTTDGAENVCDELIDSELRTDLEVLAHWIQERYYFLDCMPFDFHATVEAHTNTENHAFENSILGLRQRVYQFCTEFGWFLTADNADQPFGYMVTMNFFLNFCRELYGDWLDSSVVADGVQLTNVHFGAQNPAITNVFFTNGEFDPIRDIGITNYYAEDAAAVVIEGYFNSADLNSISGYNSPALLEVKHRVHLYIMEWLYSGIVPITEEKEQA